MKKLSTLVPNGDVKEAQGYVLFTMIASLAVGFLLGLGAAYVWGFA